VATVGLIESKFAASSVGNRDGAIGQPFHIRDPEQLEFLRSSSDADL
jgi:hypothetical protein